MRPAGHGGYLSLAPDLYSTGGRLRCVAAALRAARSGQGRAYGDIEGARRYPAGRADCTGRVGVTGLCMGGGLALRAAPRYPSGAAAVNYGEVPADAGEHLAGAGPVVGSKGGRDRRLAGHPQRLESALTALGVPQAVKVHPSAEDGWRRISGFFAEHLTAPPDAAPPA